MWELQVGLYLHPEKKGVFQVATKIANWFNNKKLNLYCPKELAPFIKGQIVPLSYEEMLSCVDTVIVLGGDGTFLGAARAFSGHNIPLLGFNLGQLGFLMENAVEEVDVILERLLAKNFTIEECMMLKGSIYREGRLVEEVICFNDIVVTKASYINQIELKVFINKDHVATYPGDGLIVATPTGSTAYNLSAGGPIVNPKVKSIIITPICPHTFYSRSLIISADEEVIIENSRPKQKTVVTADGKEGILLACADLIKIKRAQEKTLVVRFADWSFYQILANRLKYRDI